MQRKRKRSRQIKRIPKRKRHPRKMKSLQRRMIKRTVKKTPPHQQMKKVLQKRLIHPILVILLTKVQQVQTKVLLQTLGILHPQEILLLILVIQGRLQSQRLHQSQRQNLNQNQSLRLNPLYHL